ncbi:MAG: peptidylprolyl isomerase [Nanoarchaeota archaeon]
MVNKNEFIEIEYTAMIRENKEVFDTTNVEIARSNNIYGEDIAYKPAIVCVGQNHLIKGVDESFESKNVGDSYKLELKDEDAFGKKDAELIQFLTLESFREHNIMPVPGLHINIDGGLGVVKVVSGGRVIVDFNHPLSGRDVIYEIKINRIVTDTNEKINALIKELLPFDAKVEIKEGVLSISIDSGFQGKINEEELGEKIKELIPEIKEVKFI